MGGNGNWFSHLENRVGGLKKLKREIPYDPVILLLGFTQIKCILIFVFMSDTKNILVQSIYSNFIYVNSTGNMFAHQCLPVAMMGFMDSSLNNRIKKRELV